MNDMQKPENISLAPASKTVIDIPPEQPESVDKELAEQLIAALPQLKFALIGKPLNRILNQNIWFTCLKDENFPLSYENVHLVYFEDFSFLIGQELFYITLSGSQMYRIKLNTVTDITIYETKNIPVKKFPKWNFSQNKNFKDISHIYDFLIGAKVTDITLEFERFNGKEPYAGTLETFIIHLSNGCQIAIFNEDDNPGMRILQSNAPVRHTAKAYG